MSKLKIDDGVAKKKGGITMKESLARIKLLEAVTERHLYLDKMWRDVEFALVKEMPILENVIYVSMPNLDNPDCEPENEVQCLSVLGIPRSRGGRQICVGRLYRGYFDSDEDHIYWTPIRECSPAVRFAAVAYVKELETKVYDAAKKSVEQLDSAITLLDNILCPRLVD
jgi:hypothetical protein